MAPSAVSQLASGLASGHENLGEGLLIDPLDPLDDHGADFLYRDARFAIPRRQSGLLNPPYEPAGYLPELNPGAK